MLPLEWQTRALPPFTISMEETNKIIKINPAAVNPLLYINNGDLSTLFLTINNNNNPHKTPNKQSGSS